MFSAMGWQYNRAVSDRCYVDGANHVPAIRLEALWGVVGKPAFHFAIDEQFAAKCHVSFDGNAAGYAVRRGIEGRRLMSSIRDWGGRASFWVGSKHMYREWRIHFDCA